MFKTRLLSGIVLVIAALVLIITGGDVLLVQPDMEPDSVRRLCDAVSGTCGGRCAVFAGTGGSYRWAVIHPGQALRAFIRDMNQALHSRGGGRDGFAQGSAACTEEELRAFFAQ